MVSGLLRRFRRAVAMPLVPVCVGVLTLLTLQSCKSTAASDKAAGAETEAPAPKEDYVLSVTLNKSVYRPGEAVQATVSLMNNTEKKVTWRDLDANSCAFMFGREKDPERMRRDAVSSTQDPKVGMVDLEAGQTRTRKFLLTRLTHFEGPLSVQVHYDPNVAGIGEQESKLFSNTVAYQVSGKPLFERDPAGLLLKQEAINVAQAQVPGDVQAAEAILVEDEKGFYKWWVNVKVQPAGQVAKLQAFLIDPYTGHVWSRQVKPFNPVLAEDKRFKRPEGLPTRDPAQGVPPPGKR